MHYILIFRKCDERLPNCTRCGELNLQCQYLKPKAATQSPQMQDIYHLHENNLEVYSNPDGLLSPSTSTKLNEEDGISSIPSDLYTPGARFPSTSDTGHHPLQKSDLPPLDAQDLELLTHYLTHTSQTIPYDKADLYALHIGIPNLAFTSKPLMGSVLALAAVCQCHDLLQPTTFVKKDDDRELSLFSLPQIQKLLALAESHHRSSLHQIQEAIGTERYDTVLANATLMTLYGNAVHCVRIRLIQLYNEKEGDLIGRPIPPEFVPAQSQWISVIRAVHCAFVGLRAEVETECLVENRAIPSSGLLQEAAGESGLTDGVGEVKCPQDGPTETTMQLFQPIVTATIGGAMDNLRQKVQRIREEINNATDVDTQVCTKALGILESIISETLPGIINTTSETTSPGEMHDDGFIGRLSLVTPWLRAYTARVTSNSGLSNETPGPSSTSHPMRRKITSFLNRVDADYLSLVQETLERMSLPVFGEPGCGKENAESRCAMEIFAHWLVLMCLLDGVWWIGGIGMWELGRVASYMEGVQEIEQEKEEAWWPASMYRIRLELAKQQV